MTLLVKSSRKTPLTIVYDAIERNLRAHGLTHMVSWNSSRDPEPDVREEADLPEIQVRPTAMTVELGHSSCGTNVTATYTILIATGDDRLGYLLYPVQWALLLAMKSMKYGSSHAACLDDLMWRDKNFVTNTEVVSCTADLDLSMQRGIEGWDALWDINVFMSFNDEDLVL